MGVYKPKNTPFYHYSFTIPGRPQQRGSTGYTDKKLAEAFYFKVRAEAKENHDFKRPQKITVSELLEWTNQKYWHYEDWEVNVRAILADFGTRRAADVTLEMVLDYRERRLKTVVTSSVNRELVYLRAAYNYAIKNRMLFKNPVSDVEFFNERDRRRDKFLKPEEKRMLLEAAPRTLRDLILFALKTGMRQGEILGLRWSDIDPRTNTIKVTSYKGEDVIVRHVPIFAQTQEVLDRQNRATEFVFTDRHGQQLTENSTVKSTYHRLIKRLGIQGGNFTFHDLRHTFASDYLMMGGTMSALQDILGHRSADTTRRYGHLSKEHLRAEIDRLPRESFDLNVKGWPEKENFYQTGSKVEKIENQADENA